MGILESLLLNSLFQKYFLIIVKKIYINGIDGSIMMKRQLFIVLYDSDKCFLYIFSKERKARMHILY